MQFSRQRKGNTETIKRVSIKFSHHCDLELHFFETATDLQKPKAVSVSVQLITT